MGPTKGVTDFVTLYFWPKPAIAVVRCFAGLLITPNMVTLVSLIFVLMTIWLFWNGFFIFGIFTAWIMTFLDTVDGKTGGELLLHHLSLVISSIMV